MLSRRDSLKLGGLAATWAVVHSAGIARAQRPRQIRHDVGNLEPDHQIIKSYAKAVQAMKGLPRGDRRSWAHQANVHRDFCPHSNWFFLPWHRAYLDAFENIVREMSDDADFTLPYWNWATTPILPAAFRRRRVDGADNPLYDGSRLGEVNGGQSLGPALGGSPAEFDERIMGRMLQLSDFELFGSSRPDGQNSSDAETWQQAPGQSAALESGPHGLIHVYTSGNMGAVDTAGRDPIFWLHHCMVDRMWARWTAAGHRNPRSRMWRDVTFAREFVGGDGQPRSYTVSGVTSTASLGYVYDDVPVPEEVAVSAESDEDAAAMSERAVAAFSAPSAAPITPNQVSEVSVPVTGEARQIFANLRAPAPQAAFTVESTTSAGSGAAESPRVFARVQDLALDGGSDLTIRIFLNCDYATPATPVTDPRYVATLSLFGLDASGHAGHSEGAGGPSVVIDLTTTLDNLRRIGEPVAEELKFQLLGVQREGAAAPSTVDFRGIEVLLV